MNPVDAATALLVTKTRLERDAAQEKWASSLSMAEVLVSVDRRLYRVVNPVPGTYPELV